ncbi:MAG: hypothetical protein MUO59_00225 [Actinobacteria bacterium]|nr:hypothetical protein [Actinomycetota bacterium]
MVHDMHHPGEHNALSLVNKMRPNNTNINNTNLNNVKRTSREGDVENSGEMVEEKNTEDEEDIKDIRRKIKESLEENRKPNFIEHKDSRKDKSTYEKSKYSNSSVVEEYPRLKRYGSREKEQLAEEMAEELKDNHSLGAFHTIVDKISEQKIRIFLSIIKDTHLAGKIKKSRGAMFISLAKAYAKSSGFFRHTLGEPPPPFAPNQSNTGFSTTDELLF